MDNGSRNFVLGSELLLLFSKVLLLLVRVWWGTFCFQIYLKQIFQNASPWFGPCHHSYTMHIIDIIFMWHILCIFESQYFGCKGTALNAGSGCARPAQLARISLHVACLASLAYPHDRQGKTTHLALPAHCHQQLLRRKGDHALHQACVLLGVKVGLCLKLKGHQGSEPYNLPW